jgi:hypothetical protein
MYFAATGGKAADLLATVDRARATPMRYADYGCADTGALGSQPAIGHLIWDRLRRSELLAQLHRGKHWSTKSIGKLYVGLRYFAFEFPFNQRATGTVLPGALAAWAMVRSSTR